MDLSTQPLLLPSSPNSGITIQSIEDSFSDTAPSVSGRESSGHDEAVFDSNPESHSTRQSSPHTSSEYDSHDSIQCEEREEEKEEEEEEVNDESHIQDDEDDIISTLPPDSRVSSCLPFLQHEPLPYTPPKQRSPFRNPSSVRGMQLDLTPPHLRSPTGTSRRSQHSRTPHHRTSTPRSVRSHFSTRHQQPRSPPKPARPSPPPSKKEHPLVLLHITLLPVASPYSAASLSAIAPPHVLANWTLLREKVPDTVLERGILIPHPRDDYELLEERLLESLELAAPRILKCGHFRLEPEEEAALFADLREGTQAERYASCTHHDVCEVGTCATTAAAATRAGVETEDEDEGNDDLDLCADCGRRVRDGRMGSAGKGNRRWEIRIYAANGLMRAGAWGAAWREMERVDVEICPWMEDSIRRELEEARAAEEREAAVAREMEAEAEGHVVQGDAVGGGSSGGGAVGGRGGSPCRMDEERRKEIYGDVASAHDTGTTGIMRGGEAKGQAFIDGLEDDGSATRIRVQARAGAHRGKPAAAATTSREVPLQRLLLNYVRLLLQDRKNVALALLGFAVLLLAVRPSGRSVPVASTASLAPPTLSSRVAYVSPAPVASSAAAAVVEPGRLEIATVLSVESALSMTESGAVGVSVPTAVESDVPTIEPAVPVG